MQSLFESLGVNVVFGGYIFIVLVLAFIVNRISKRSKTEDGDDRFLAMLDWFETNGFGTFFHILVLGGTLLLALIGWRIPAEIERIYGAGASFGLIFPKVEIGMVGRAAQVIGAFGLGFVALRAMRFFVPIITILVFAILIAMSVGYIFGIDIKGMIGA